MKCEKCKATDINANNTVKNLDGTTYCLKCYKEICEGLRKGVFTNGEYNGHIDTVNTLNSYMKGIMLNTKKYCMDNMLLKRKDYYAVLDKIIKREEEYCLHMFGKERGALSDNETIELFLYSSKRVPTGVSSINGHKYALDFEERYGGGLYCKNILGL